MGDGGWGLRGVRKEEEGVMGRVGEGYWTWQVTYAGAAAL